MMRTTQNGTAVHACLRMVESIEEASTTEEDVSGWLVDVIEMQADTAGGMTLVYTVGGPYVELRLGDGCPKVVAHWGGDTHVAQVSIHEDIVAGILDVYWRPTMEAALREHR